MRCGVVDRRSLRCKGAALGGMLALLLLTARTSVAMSNEPAGFGRLQFGASAAAAQKAFPALHPKGTEQFLSLYELRDQTVLGLKPCALELRFVDDQLYEIQFTCEPRDRVPKALEKTFGKPSQTGPAGASWLGERRTVSLRAKSGIFAFTDRARGQIANRKLLRYVLESQARGGTPVPTPAK